MNHCPLMKLKYFHLCLCVCVLVYICVYTYVCVIYMYGRLGMTPSQSQSGWDAYTSWSQIWSAKFLIQYTTIYIELPAACDTNFFVLYTTAKTKLNLKWALVNHKSMVCMLTIHCKNAWIKEPKEWLVQFQWVYVPLHELRPQPSIIPRIALWNDTFEIRISFLATNWPSRVSFHCAILGVMLEKIQFIESSTHTYDVIYI